MDSYTPLAACLLLFIAVGVGFIFVHLVAGKFLRPNKPDAEKKTIYECGEPTIGSAWIQFDLRFYVVALLFVIFDVEVAFFFPWAEVFGKANAIVAAESPANDEQRIEFAIKANTLASSPTPFPYSVDQLEKMKVAEPEVYKRLMEKLKSELKPEELKDRAHQYAWFAFMDILVFFGVLLVGFAYLWKRGDLAWVRSTLAETAPLPVAPIETQLEKRELAGTSAASH